MIGAFATTSGLPAMYFSLKTGKPLTSSALLASVGTLQLEFQYLSDLTGDRRYSDAALGVYNLLPKTDTKGLYPKYLDVTAGLLLLIKFEGKFITPPSYGIGPDADSFYEYLLKLWISTGIPKYREMYDSSADAILSNILKKSKEDKYYFMQEGSSDSFHHLSCFTGGMFALGAATKTEGDWTYKLDIGRRVTDTCYSLYSDSKTGLGGDTGRVSSDGNKIEASGKVALRPEVVESLFYMYRISGDYVYKQHALDIIDSLEKNTRTAAGYHSIDGGPFDRMESFFIAETLKYLWLIFDDNQLPLTEYVFNTEAHPFSIRGAGRRKDQSKWIK